MRWPVIPVALVFAESLVALGVIRIAACWAFQPMHSSPRSTENWSIAPFRRSTFLCSSSNEEVVTEREDIINSDILEEEKSRLIQLCQSSSPNLADIREAMIDLEVQTVSDPNLLLSGEWELLYASTDVTRSSPFFWAFRKAFPDATSDAIFGITDAIPAPLKEVGPARQEIDVTAGPNGRGRLISRVQVATLGGAATSIMTTRASILGLVDGDMTRLRVKIETTKPEQSTLLDKLLGPLSATLQEQLPPFPSGEALERIVPGASEVVLRTTFCDATLRISKNDDRPDDEFFIWKRKSFASYDVL